MCRNFLTTPVPVNDRAHMKTNTPEVRTLFRKTKKTALHQKEASDKTWRFLRIAAGAEILLAAVLLIVYAALTARSPADPLQDGIRHLKELESKDLTAIEREVKLIRQEARAKAIAEGSLSVWAQFDDYVIFGDSRTVGFYFYEFLDQQRIIADGGLTIADLASHMDQIRLLNPSSLFLCTGLNDVSIGYWPTPEDYVEAYEELMQQLMSELPDTHIYINSIFPAKDPAFDLSEDWRKIPEYNTAVRTWCEEKGYSYIDNTQVFEDHQDLYDSDGIHFAREFYQYWAANMLAGMETE